VTSVSKHVGLLSVNGDNRLNRYCRTVSLFSPELIISFTIITASASADLEAIRDLFRNYVSSFPRDKFPEYPNQSFEEEITSLPGVYSSPLIARDIENKAPIGCIGLRALDTPGWCELRRMYVVPQWRGRGLGKALAEAIVSAAKEAGYKKIVLDAHLQN
jgi:GNAT superfamily N-acetyltransferase